MNLRQFIRELESIACDVDDAQAVEVQMADMLPVVTPVYKEGVVYITDQEEIDN